MRFEHTHKLSHTPCYITYHSTWEICLSRIFRKPSLPSTIPVSQSRTWRPASYGLFLCIPFCVLSLESTAAFDSIHGEKACAERKLLRWGMHAPTSSHSHWTSLNLAMPSLPVLSSLPSYLPFPRYNLFISTLWLLSPLSLSTLLSHSLDSSCLSAPCMCQPFSFALQRRRRVKPKGLGKIPSWPQQFNFHQRWVRVSWDASRLSANTQPLHYSGIPECCTCTIHTVSITIIVAQ